MTITQDDLREFARFADEKLRSGEKGTLLELACEWESRRDIGGAGSQTAPVNADLETVRELAKLFPDTPADDQLKRALARRGGVTTAEMLGRAMLAAARARRG